MEGENELNLFFKENRPVVTTMLHSAEYDEIVSEIKKTLDFGTDAFGLQLETMKDSDKTDEKLMSVFKAMDGKPAYVTYYRTGEANCNIGDDKLADELVRAFKCGGKLIDVPGGMFADERLTFWDYDYQFSEDENIVKKQRELIDKLHSMGASVLMSTHIKRFANMEEVLKIALSQQNRGADIAKVVTEANSSEEFLENCRITLELKKRLDIPFLFLCNGTHCRTHRLISPQLGSCMYLSAMTNSNQPLPDDVKAFMELNNYENMPWN